MFTVSFPLIAFERQPNADYRVRRERFAAKLDAQSVALLFANSEAEGQNALGGFRQNDDFYYLTGWNEPGAAVLIAPANDKRPYTEILFLPAHNATQERWTGPKLGAENAEAPRVTGFDRVETLDKMRDRLVALLPGQTAVIYTDPEHDVAARVAQADECVSELHVVSQCNADLRRIARDERRGRDHVDPQRHRCHGRSAQSGDAQREAEA